MIRDNLFKNRELYSPHSLFGIISSGYAAEAEFASMYESFNDLTTVNKQHFVEWFTGNTLRTDTWNLEAVAGSIDSATGMYDGVDYGFYIKNSNNSDHTQIDFGASGSEIRQYGANCQMIVVHKMGCGGTYDMRSGFLNNSTNFFYTSVNWANTNNKMSLESNNGGTPTTTDSTITNDESWHVKHLELTSSNGYLDIDGVQRATTTDTLPTVKLMPFHAGEVAATGYQLNRGCFIRYMECWNT